jgi:hypothetical protein
MKKKRKERLTDLGTKINRVKVDGKIRIRI